MNPVRRKFLRLAGLGLTGAAAATTTTPWAHAEPPSMAGGASRHLFDVRLYGATGDGATIDTPAINKAIEAAYAAGGGTVRFPAGTYACYSIHLKSNIALYLDPGAIILAASVPDGGSTS